MDARSMHPLPPRYRGFVATPCRPCKGSRVRGLWPAGAWNLKAAGMTARHSASEAHEYPADPFTASDFIGQAASWGGSPKKARWEALIVTQGTVHGLEAPQMCPDPVCPDPVASLSEDVTVWVDMEVMR